MSAPFRAQPPPPLRQLPVSLCFSLHNSSTNLKSPSYRGREEQLYCFSQFPPAAYLLPRFSFGPTFLRGLLLLDQPLRPPGIGLALLLNAQLGSAYELTCYFTNWAQYRPGLGKFMPDNIDPCLCTHLIYAFAGMSNNQITTIEWNDVTLYNSFQNLKNQVLDYIHVMTYDLHGSGEGYTGENSPLFTNPAATGANAFLNVICTFLKNGATENWSSAEEVPYAYQGNEWFGYDNVKSVILKAQWLMNNLAGAMVWAIDLDDFTGTFCNQGKFPLITALKTTLGAAQLLLFLSSQSQQLLPQQLHLVVAAVEAEALAEALAEVDSVQEKPAVFTQLLETITPSGTVSMESPISNTARLAWCLTLAAHAATGRKRHPVSEQNHVNEQIL
ncbi:hypothetical protein NDU88_004376 [Pleurodeles waltl]|uniref:GH18 domain-containing protein n=1 Tax=Pleurodeles waltl TaxID=8319 RepID=A0AAV7QCU5_PLEWA|nr:hypothetical protein NDU88_004376 [Pleurodeles waltl]